MQLLSFLILIKSMCNIQNYLYKDVPWLVIASIGGSLLYVLSPIDLIPDFIPFVGYLDDALVFAACLKFAQQDLEKYREWKNAGSSGAKDGEAQTVEEAIVR